MPNYYPPEIGGIEQVAYDIVNSLMEKNEQEVICFTHERRTRIEISNGVKIIRCGTKVSLSSQAMSLEYGNLLKKEIKSFQPNIIIIHLPNPFNVYFLQRYIPNNCKLIVYWHSDIIKQKIIKKLFHVQTNKILKRANKIVATSPNYAESSEYLPNFADKCTIIPNCINETRLYCDDNIKQEGGKLKERYGNKIICFAFGRHVKYKGFSYLVEAARLLGDQYLFFLGGTGVLTSRLRKQANGLKNFIFLGKISEEELKKYLLASDIFCFPSITKNEAFGIALAEGLYFGKPAVTFKINGSGVSYVNVDSLTGIEVNTVDSKQYAEAIKRLGVNKKLRKEYGENARKRVKNKFLYEDFVKNVNMLIDNM